jgi:hypothetical protein
MPSKTKRLCEQEPGWPARGRVKMLLGQAAEQLDAAWFKSSIRIIG